MGYNKDGLLEQIKDIFPSFAIGISMAIIVFLMTYINISPFVLLPLQMLIGAIYVILICEVAKKEEYLEIKSIAIKIFKKIFKR